MRPEGGCRLRIDPGGQAEQARGRRVRIKGAGKETGNPDRCGRAQGAPAPVALQGGPLAGIRISGQALEQRFDVAKPNRQALAGKRIDRLGAVADRRKPRPAAADAARSYGEFPRRILQPPGSDLRPAEIADDLFGIRLLPRRRRRRGGRG